VFLAGALAWAVETTCLAEAMYFEARGESVESQLLVAEVVLNRTEDPYFGSNSVCEILDQPGQFPWADGPRTKKEPEAWDQVLELACGIKLETVQLPGTDATFFHSGPQPKGFKGLQLLGKVGPHIFYERKPNG